jgi:hypothetical protein
MRINQDPPTFQCSVLLSPLLGVQRANPRETGSLFRTSLITQIKGPGVGGSGFLCVPEGQSSFIYIISHGYITENFMTSKRDFP